MVNMAWRAGNAGGRALLSRAAATESTARRTATKRPFHCDVRGGRAAAGDVTRLATPSPSTPLSNHEG